MQIAGLWNISHRNDKNVLQKRKLVNEWNLPNISVNYGTHTHTFILERERERESRRQRLIEIVTFSGQSVPFSRHNNKLHCIIDEVLYNLKPNVRYNWHIVSEKVAYSSPPKGNKFTDLLERLGDGMTDDTKISMKMFLHGIAIILLKKGSNDIFIVF